MCGIAGFLERNANTDAAQIATAMADVLWHRGPDGDGVWSEERDGLVTALSHRRLSIIDLRESAAQPMISADERWLLTFNGEIYNYGRLAESTDIELRTTSDSEVLLELIARDGVEATLPRLIGMFAFAAWDRERRELWVARDRIGIKPLYWTRQGDVVAFASQLKSLKRHPRLDLEISSTAVTAFLRDGYIPSPQSIFERVCKLRPGHFVKFGTDLEPKVGCYWDLRDVALRGLANPAAAADALTEELDELLTDAVKLRMISDVPLGAFLSGGTDSSLVTAYMQRHSDQPVKTFSIGFAEKSHDEAPYARAVAEHLGTEHHELYVRSKDALALIPQLPTWYDEPFSDSSQLPTTLVSKLAREHVTVALSGDGGDELFYGYERYFVMSRLRRGFVGPARLRRALGRSLTRVTSRFRSRRARSMSEALALRDDVDFYRWMTTTHRDPASLTTAAAADDERLDLPLHEIDEFAKKMQLIDQWRYLHDDILTKVDRASMSVSLEVRVPILDHRIIELSWRVPTGFNMTHDEGKGPLRELLYRDVPRDLLERPKRGFAVPVAKWLRRELRDWAEVYLDPASIADGGVLAVEPVRTLWEEHLEGERNHEGPLWAILSLSAWMEAFESL